MRLRDRFEAGDRDGFNGAWSDYVRDVCGLAERTMRELLQIARAADPPAEAERMRERVREGMDKTRKKIMEKQRRQAPTG